MIGTHCIQRETYWERLLIRDRISVCTSYILAITMEDESDEQIVRYDEQEEDMISRQLNPINKPL